VTVQARQLNRGLVGLGAGVGEEDPIHIRALTQQVGEFLLPADRVQVRGMQQACRLFLDCRG
jgi:hypothetical protein